MSSWPSPNYLFAAAIQAWKSMGGGLTGDNYQAITQGMKFTCETMTGPQPAAWQEPVCPGTPRRNPAGGLCGSCPDGRPGQAQCWDYQRARPPRKTKETAATGRSYTCYRPNTQTARTPNMTIRAAAIRAHHRMRFELVMFPSSSNRANSPNKPNKENQRNAEFPVKRVTGPSSPRNPR